MMSPEVKKMLDRIMGGKATFSSSEEFQCHHCGWKPKEQGTPIRIHNDGKSFLCNNCSLTSATSKEFRKQHGYDVDNEFGSEAEDVLSGVELMLELASMTGEESLEELEAFGKKIHAFNKKVGIKTDEEPSDDTSNNGGKTDYYQLPTDDEGNVLVRDFDDFAEWRELNGNQFNIGKVAWTFNAGRHSGTDYIRDLNKIIHYAQREKNRVLKQGE